MKRAIRRHHMAKIKKIVNIEIEKIEARYRRNAMLGRVSLDTLEMIKQHCIQQARIDDGRVSRRLRVGAVRFFCGCDWCIGNLTYSSKKEILRISDEEKDFLSGNLDMEIQTTGMEWLYSEELADIYHE